MDGFQDGVVGAKSKNIAGVHCDPYSPCNCVFPTETLILNFGVAVWTAQGPDCEQGHWQEHRRYRLSMLKASMA